MAQNIGQAANIAQLLGVDALGLISTIVQAAQAVQRNKETCQELVQDVQQIRDLLRMQQDPEMMRPDEIVVALIGLEGTLQEAHRLVTSCRDCSVAYRIFMGWKQTEHQFRRVKKKIAKHLRFYPMISHADITCRLERLNNGAQSICSPHDASGVLTSSSIHSNRHASNDNSRVESTFEPVELQTLQAGTETIPLEEHQQTGHKEIIEALSARRSRFRWRKRRLPLKNVPKNVEIPPHICELTKPGFSVFSMRELEGATNEFSTALRKDREFTVYKVIIIFKRGQYVLGFIVGQTQRREYTQGTLYDGLQVVVKRYSKEWALSKQEVAIEVRSMTQLQHTNILKLLGCCTRNEEIILVYKFMSNGCLHDQIFGAGYSMLSWPLRFQIFEGIAQGALYLHKHCGLRIIHRDLNPRNILLDDCYIPKICNFELSFLLPQIEDEVQTKVRGTMGFIAPEFLCNGRISVQTDVYSYGILLLEMITGKVNTDVIKHDCDITLTKWVQHLWEEENLTGCIDPRLVVVAHNSQKEEIKRWIHIALLCVENNPAQRVKDMAEVLRMLSDKNQELPVPTFLTPETAGTPECICNNDLSDDEITLEPRD